MFKRSMKWLLQNGGGRSPTLQKKGAPLNKRISIAAIAAAAISRLANLVPIGLEGKAPTKKRLFHSVSGDDKRVKGKKSKSLKIRANRRKARRI